MFKPYPKGSTELIQELTVHIPPVPKLSIIQNYKLPKKKQKWYRTELPENWEELREEEIFKQKNDLYYTNPKLEEFRRQEWHRRLNGFWFYNFGKPTYITGKHYFYVNWWQLDTGYPDYRDTDRKIHYFWQHCIENPNCYGLLEITMRRNGKTFRACSEMYEEISRPPQKRSGGIQSKPPSDAKELFAEKLIEPWKDLPDFFKPEYNSGSDPKTILSFFRDIRKGMAAKKVKYSGDEELRNFIDWKISKEKAYDGTNKARIFHDEVGKLNPVEEANAKKRWEVVKPCLIKNGEIYGKMYMTTTVEEMKDGGEVCQEIWHESNPLELDGNKETKSGLHRYFLSALEGTFFDEYGFPDVERARKKHDATRLALKDDPIALNSYKRKHPYDIDEAFIVDSERCVFNANILNDRLAELNYLENVTTKGDFIWKDGKRDDKVIWIPNPVNGRWEVSWLPDKDEQTNVIDKIISFNGSPIFKPTNKEKFALAADPISHTVTVDQRKSRASSHVFRKFDTLIDSPSAVDQFGRIDWETHNYIAEYLYRPIEPDEYFEALICACVFFGCEILIENNKIGAINYFKKRGYQNFVMQRPKETFLNERYNQDTPGIPSSRPIINQYTEKQQTFVQYHGHRINFKYLIMDLLKFDPSNTTKFDAVVSASLALIAADKILPKPKETVGGLAYVRTYNNKGTTSMGNKASYWADENIEDNINVN